MNDTELDRLLDTWETPEPPPSLREGLRARFPQADRPRFARPLGWVLVIAVASVTLANRHGAEQRESLGLADRPRLELAVREFSGGARGLASNRHSGADPPI
jgi:hypothetical protein